VLAERAGSFDAQFMAPRTYLPAFEG
jgi:hypothetical protein